MRQVITYKQAQTIKKRYENGESVLDLADIYGVSRATIYYSIKRASKPPVENDLIYSLSISLPTWAVDKLRLQARLEGEKFVSVVVRKILSDYFSSKRPLPPVSRKDRFSSSVSVKLDKNLYDKFIKEAKRRGYRPSRLGRAILLSYLM